MHKGFVPKNQIGEESTPKCSHDKTCGRLQFESVDPMEQPALKNVNNCLNTNIYSFLETTGGQSYNLYLNVVHFFNTSVN